MLLVALGLGQPCALPAATPDSITVTRLRYHGWPDSILVGNGLVEAVIVPAIGRVMQYRLAGAAEGPIWENASLRGRLHDPASMEWSNFGGDKAWPSPQSDWPRTIRRTWPPPGGFDSRPMQASVEGTAVTLTSPVDPDYGIRVRRRIELAADRPVMTITTRYEKVDRPSQEVAVWTITQLKDPAAVYALRPGASHPGPAYVRQSDEPPPSLQVADGLLSLRRDPAKSHKIGVRSGALVWVGPNEVLRLDATVVAGARYPDDDSSAEVYTQADPLPYVELEMLGPLVTLKAGDAVEETVRYTLGRRTASDPAAEIRRLPAR